jgi:hypothetical protein
MSGKLKISGIFSCLAFRLSILLWVGTAVTPMGVVAAEADPSSTESSPRKGWEDSSFFVLEKNFDRNPFQVASVKLPPLPKELSPMGTGPQKHKAKEENDRAESVETKKEEDKEMAQKPAATEMGDKAKVPPDSVPVSPVGGDLPTASTSPPTPVVNEEKVTVSPFLEWIRLNREAAETARLTRKKKESRSSPEGEKANPEEAEDLFLHVRFPYLGNQTPPPGGGAVIYSTPKK